MGLLRIFTRSNKSLEVHRRLLFCIPVRKVTLLLPLTIMCKEAVNKSPYYRMHTLDINHPLTPHLHKVIDGGWGRNALSRRLHYLCPIMRR